MTSRTTIRDLKKVRDLINKQAGFNPETLEPFTTGAYDIDQSNGGYRLIQFSDGTSERDITPRASKRETFELMLAFYDGMQAGSK